MKCINNNKGNLKVLVRSLRTKKYEKFTIQGDSLPVLQREKSKEDKPRQ